MAYKRIDIKSILQYEDDTSVEGVFFYDGKKHFDKNYERTAAVLVDANGNTIDAIIWQSAWDASISGMYDYEDKFVAYIKGVKKSYQGKPQISIDRLAPLSPDEDEYSELTKVYVSYRQVLNNEEKDEYVRELKKLIGVVRNRYYKQLLVDLFDDSMIEKFREWTAAWERHHAFPGGLLVHTVDVAKKCAAYADVSRSVDKDLLITAALLHDIAKVDEYDGFPSKRRLYMGRLLFHASMGAEKIGFKVKEYRENIKGDRTSVSDFPQNLEIQLKHCILSHHGKPEYGAAVVPMILEARILHIMDDADATERYYEERVLADPIMFNANMDKDKVRGYYDDFTREYAYPTMTLKEYTEKTYDFELPLDDRDWEPSNFEESEEEELPF